MKTLSFTEFLESKFKSFSHGHDFTHEEVNGLYYLKEDYELAQDLYIDYEWNVFIKKLAKELPREKGNELDRSTIKRNSSGRLSQRGKSSIRSI